MINKKGMTIAEIIIAVLLISIVVVFLLNLLVTIKTYNDKNQNASDLSINQVVIIKAVQKDFSDYNLKGVSSCTSADLSSSGKNVIVPAGSSNIYCLKFTFDSSLTDENIGYLLQYTYKSDNVSNTNIIGYKRGTNQVVRESYVNMNPASDKGSVTSSCSSTAYSNCALKIVMPVIDKYLDDYSIELSYIYTNTAGSFTYSKANNVYGFTIK